MTLKEAQLLTLKVLKQVMEEKLDQHNVQLAQVRPVSFYYIHSYTKIDGLSFLRLHQPAGSRF